jgi:adenylate cyclase
MLFDRFWNKTIILFSCFFIIHISAHRLSAINTEGIPFIINYDSKDYKGSNKVFQVIQDTNQIVFASTINNIIVFDGNQWQSISIKGKPCFDEISGKIYVGGYSDYGKIGFTEKEGFVFQSMNVQEDDFGQINSLFVFENKLVFATQKDVYVFKNGVLELSYTNENTVSLFRSGKNLYLHVENQGLFVYENHEFVEASGGKFFARKEIVNILSFKSVEYIVTRNSGIYYYDKNLFYVLPESKELLIEKNISCAKKSKDKIAIGTHNDGIIILNSKGYLDKSYSFESGLYSSEINNIYIDKNEDCWLSTNYGISLLDQRSAISYFNEYNGLSGVINDIIEYNNLLYIATSQGLYSYNEKENELLLIPGKEYYVYNLFLFNNELYCSTEKGVFKQTNNNWMLFYDAIWLFAKQSETNKEVLLVANQNGFFIYKTFEKQLYRLFSLSSITKDINSITEDKKSIWVGTNYNGVYKIGYNHTYDSITDIQQFRRVNKHNINWVKVVSNKMKTIFLTKEGLFKFNYSTGEFDNEKGIAENLIEKSEYINPLKFTNSKSWFATYNDKNSACKIGCQNIDSAGQVLNEYFLTAFTNNHVIKFFPSDNNLWGVTEKGLFFLQNTNPVEKIKSKSFFTEIAFDTDSVLRLNPTIYNIIYVPRGVRNIKLSATTTDFSNRDNLLYQFKVDGYSKAWTNWQAKNRVTFNNLPNGKYAIKVRTKDLNGHISSVSSIQIVLKPPFYRSLFAYILYLLIVVSGFYLIVKWRAYNFAVEKFKLEETINKRTKELIIQREKTEELLKTYAPKETIEKLHDFRKERAHRYKMVTILFADIMGFSEIADQDSSTEIIDELDKFYFHFDQVVERLNIKKIKTVGDTYMSAGGIPQKNRTNPIEVVLAAFEMQQYLEKLKICNRYKEIKLWDIRFGIHTGPVFAEENPRKKHPFDIWGETVNIASRMQSSGDIGKVNISGNTYELIREYFICQYRGKMPVKYKGDLDMYYIEGFRPKLSVDQKGFLPNDAFKTKLALIRYDDLEESVLNRLEKELPGNMHYHNLKHTIDVIVQVELIGRSEGISDEELLLLKTAALFHDFGFIFGYQDHELLGIKQVKEILPKYDYTEEQIQKIEDLIFVTKLPPEPKNRIEEIMCDADLDYLGRVDFIPVSQMLFRELVDHGKIEDNLEKWNKLQIKFIENHQYFTETAKSLRDVNKKKQLESIRKLVNST